jgi:predicted DCC family thiol-disulfide oxidoreductase YuxK
MLRTLRHYLELIRFSHTIFALPFALLAAVMAWRLRAFEGATRLVHFSGVESIVTDISHNTFQLMEYKTTIGGRTFDTTSLHAYWHVFRWQELLGILLSMITARSFAMAANRLADRRLDAANPRTAGRHLPAGILSVTCVSLFVAASALGFIASLPLGLALHVGMCVTKLACFYQYMVLYAVFVPWSRTVSRASHVLQGNRSSKVQIVYDGGCILCNRSMTLVQYLDWFDRLDYVDIRSWRAGARETAGGGEFDIRAADMLAIRPGGASRAGFFAWREVVLRLPALWPLLLLLYFPGASIVGPKVYRAIASSRARFADCEEGTCSLQH